MTTNLLRLGGVPEHFNHPWQLAITSPELSDINLDWAVQLGGTGEMLAALDEGRLDMVSILTEGTVAAIDQGKDLTIVQVYVESPLQWGIHVPAGSDLEVESQLEGRPIAISRYGSGSHLMAFVHASQQGWKIDDAQFVVVGGLDNARKALGEGSAEVFFWDRFMTSPLVENGNFRRVGTIETPWPSFVIAVRNEVLVGRTTEVGQVVDAVVAHAQGLHDRPGIVGELAETYGLTEATAAEWLATTRFATRAPFDQSLRTKVLQTLSAANASTNF